MNSTELIRGIFKKLGNYKKLVFIVGCLFAALLFFYAYKKKPVYTSQATVFPLTSPSDNALSASTLSGILGLSDAPKSFSNEASINIIELTLSRNVREAVGCTRLSGYGNKTVAELLLNESNNNSSFFSKKAELPNDSTSVAILGGELIKPLLDAKMSKNGVLQINFSNTNMELITPVSYVIIDRISQFYIELKRKKALDDYNFTVIKIDSFQKVINSMDRGAIALQNATLFTPSKLEYQIPKENLNDEKGRITRQRDISINNKEEALWRLQKVTPIIEILDKPTPPFDMKKSSVILFSIAGFILGCILSGLILTGGLIYRFIKSEIHKSLFETSMDFVKS